MTHDPLNYPRQLAGLGQPLGAGYGQHRNALAQAYGGALAAANNANHGALGPSPAPAQPIPAIEDAGIRAGEIIGWRMWVAVGDYVRSIVHPFVWPHREPIITPQDKVDGGFGTFAFKEHCDLIGEYGAILSQYPTVTGTVAMWGVVIEHERGYRAEFARPLTFQFQSGGADLDRLRKNYGLEP